MNARDLFWFFAGCASVIASCFLVIPIWRSSRVAARSRRLRIILVSVIALSVVGASLFAYKYLGAPESVLSTAPMHAAAATTTAADSLEVATERLAARLSLHGGSDSDWQLLAQSYQAIGDPERATAARAHITEAGEKGVSSSNPPAAIADAENLRRKHQYTEAAKAYAQALGAGSFSADDYANYADVLASLADGTFTPQAEQYIDRALALDPRHAKALWLKASAAIKAKRYDAALTLWQRLDAVLPAGSPDHEIVAANIREAQTLSGTGSGNAPAPAAVKGSIDIATPLRTDAMAGSTLFIYAKAPQSPGPPLAVYKTTVASWPVPFLLDDSLAMMPTRRLSTFDSIVIEARISRSGDAMRKKGDLVGTSTTIKTSAAAPVRVLIDRRVD